MVGRKWLWKLIAAILNLKARRTAQGIGTELYIENIFTHDRQFVASTTEPLYYFKPRWVSDSELQYTLPSGEIRTYTIR